MKVRYWILFILINFLIFGEPANAQHKMKVTNIPVYMCNCMGFYAESDSMIIELTIDYGDLYFSKKVNKFKRIKIGSVIYLYKDYFVHKKDLFYKFKTFRVVKIKTNI